jgi:hypothetical protein
VASASRFNHDCQGIVVCWRSRTPNLCDLGALQRGRLELDHPLMTSPYVKRGRECALAQLFRASEQVAALCRKARPGRVKRQTIVHYRSRALVNQRCVCSAPGNDRDRLQNPDPWHKHWKAHDEKATTRQRLHVGAVSASGFQSALKI